MVRKRELNRANETVWSQHETVGDKETTQERVTRGAPG